MIANRCSVPFHGALVLLVFFILQLIGTNLLLECWRYWKILAIIFWVSIDGNFQLLSAAWRCFCFTYRTDYVCYYRHHSNGICQKFALHCWFIHPLAFKWLFMRSVEAKRRKCWKRKWISFPFQSRALKV